MMTNPKTAHSKREKFIDEFGGQNNKVNTPEEAIHLLGFNLPKDLMFVEVKR
jgi:hypothetical protein